MLHDVPLTAYRGCFFLERMYVLPCFGSLQTIQCSEDVVYWRSMEERRVLSVCSVMTALAVVCGVASAAQDSDFAALRAHWSFDEGRDWHHMPMPYKYDGVKAFELTGKADDMLLNEEQKADNEAWVSGRQRSGIGPGRVLTTMKELPCLNGSVTFSYWTRLYGEPNKRGVISSTPSTVWGVMNAKGQIGMRVEGKDIVFSPAAITDTDWHHVVFTRDEETGKVVLYLDGKEVASGTTPAGKLSGKFTSIATNNAALDQIHIFSKPVSAETVAALYDNHAPQVFDQTHLVEKSKPSVTGSILHQFTYDVDQDKLRVASYSQPKGGKVESNGDGTFTFTPGKSFKKKGKTSFDVVVTDDRGGYTKATMYLQDSRHLVAPPVREFRYFGALPEISTANGKQMKHRNPMVIRIRGKRPDLLIQADSHLWYSVNQSKPGKILFSKPQVLRTTTQADFETDGAAVLEGNKLIILAPLKTTEVKKRGKKVGERRKIIQ